MANAQIVLLTGASGFIAKHIAVQLLNAGYHVVGSVRSLSRGDEVRAAVTPQLDTAVALGQRLRFVALDLGQDAGWTEAMTGVDILMHTASPFPLIQPKDEDDLIRPAVEGALRALRAAQAAGVKRVVLTSSTVAVAESPLPAGQTQHDEDNWTDLNHPGLSAYAKSKTLAERAAWEFARDEAPELALTVINPSLVLGPPLDAHFGTSISVIQRLLRARDPMLPRFGFSCVDVRDVAQAHLRALTRPDSIGKRIIVAESFVWFTELAELLKARIPERRIVTRQAPDFVVRFLAIFDGAIRSILPSLGVRLDISNVRARDLLGIAFIPVADSATASATYLIDNDLIG